MARFVLLIEGNICAGKSEFVQYIDGHKDEFAAFQKAGEEVVNIPEFVDDEALKLFYHNMHRYTNIFERSCLTGRQVRHMKAKEGKGIYIFDRGMIGGAETFARNSFQEGFSTHRAYQRYLADLKDGLDQLDRTRQESWLEQLIVYLRVPDVKVLQERQRQRNTTGEVIPAGYLDRLNRLYDRYILGSAEIYPEYGVRAPQIIEIDATVDFRENVEYHPQILKQITTKMREMNIHER
ncbi:deoxynucleoside kinase [Candidatus Woesearchaeota archaeon]|nr:deoxynucleoside kinase [Candidatus Woesearchaeota archaeon]